MGQLQSKNFGGELKAELTVKYGQVPIQTMSLVPPAGTGARKVSAMLDGKSLAASVKEKDGAAEVVFQSNLILKAEQKLEVTLSTGGRPAIEASIVAGTCAVTLGTSAKAGLLSKKAL